MNLVIIGGGKASLILMDYFLSLEGFTIVGIADLNEDAPGILRAKELKIETTTRMEELIKRRETQMVIEITGNEKVGQMVLGLLRTDQEMISSRITKVMFDMIETQKRQRLLSSETLELEFRNLSGRLISTSGNIGSSLKKVNDVFRTMEILSLNAMVEAARAGEAGKAFAVVAGEMKSLVGNAEETVKEITIASQETTGTLENLNKAEKKLVTILQH